MLTGHVTEFDDPKQFDLFAKRLFDNGIQGVVSGHKPWSNRPRLFRANSLPVFMATLDTSCGSGKTTACERDINEWAFATFGRGDKISIDFEVSSNLANVKKGKGVERSRVR